MAQLRVMLAALAACSASDAAPAIATPPEGWVPVPPLATAATHALAGPNHAANVAADAWGEPAKGCYALTLTFATPGKAAAVSTRLLAEVKTAVSVRDVVEPAATADDGVLTFAFEKAPYHGHARVTIAPSGVTTLACFWNEREPAACAAACTAMIGSMR